MPQDLRFALRLLRRNPAFALIAVMVLALGIGANTAIYSVLRSALLRPLPYPDSERLIALWETNPALGMPVPGLRVQVSSQNYLEWKRANRVFEDIGAFADISVAITGTAEALQVSGVRVSANLMRFLGATAAYGRLFKDAEEDAVLLDHDFWKARFASGPGIIGRTIRVDGKPRTVAGVLRKGFALPPIWQGEVRKPDIWAPLIFTEAERSGVVGPFRSFYSIGRLKPGVTLAQARQEMESIAARLGREFPKRNDGWGINVLSVEAERASPELRQSLWLVQMAVLSLLLICCANIGNLLLARGVQREREFMIRIAIGAGRWHIIRQLLVEGCVLSGLGLAAGLAAARWSLQAMAAWSPEPLNRPEHFQPDITALVFAALLATGCAILFGLIPALRREATPSRYGRRLPMFALTTVQIALALLLLTGSGLLVKSLWRVLGKDTGVRTDEIVTMRVNLHPEHYEKVERARAFWRQLIDTVCVTPEIVACGLTTNLPMRTIYGGTFTIEGQPPDAKPLGADFRTADKDYFNAMGIRMVEGRAFMRAEVDRALTANVVILDATLAQRLWPGQSALGKRVKPYDWGNAGQWHTVVGVVAPVRQTGPEYEPRPEITVPGIWRNMTLVVRTKGDPARLEPSLRQAVHALDPNQPVAALETMRQVVRSWGEERRTYLILLAVFTMLATVVAAVGLYGVLTSWVAHRRRDLGIRLALGASNRRLIWAALSHGILSGVAGLVIGSCAAAALGRWTASLLFEVSPWDFTVYGASALVVLVTALVASAGPARAAAQVNPAELLRE